jgi:glutathione-regulated potassium-efflux system ancillary protein KefF
VGSDHWGYEHHFELGDHPNFAALSSQSKRRRFTAECNWQPYFAVHNTFTCNEPALIRGRESYRRRLMNYLMLHAETELPSTDAEEPTHG